MSMCASFIDAYHQSHMSSLRTCLTSEHWQNIASTSNSINADSGNATLDKVLRASFYSIPRYGEPGAWQDFSMWTKNGNPFTRGGEL